MFIDVGHKGRVLSLPPSVSLHLLYRLVHGFSLNQNSITRNHATGPLCSCSTVHQYGLVSLNGFVNLGNRCSILLDVSRTITAQGIYILFDAVVFDRLLFRLVGRITRKRTHERNDHIDVVFLNLFAYLCG